MNKNLDETVKYLRWYSQRTPGTYGDWSWLIQKYLPSIKKLEANKNPENKILISDSYYRVGDIFDFMGESAQVLRTVS